MNPDDNKFEPLHEEFDFVEDAKSTATQELLAKLESRKKTLEEGRLIRPDGSPVPEHWSIFQVDEIVEIKNYRFKVVHIGEKHMLVEPFGPVVPGGRHAVLVGMET